MSSFNFGGTAGTGGGFTFGGAQTTATTNAGSTGFSFGQQTSTPAAGGFNFGGAASATSTPAAATVPAMTGFGVQPVVTQAPGGFSFGGAGAAPAASTNPTAPSGGFSFGTPAAAGTTGLGGVTGGFSAASGLGAKPASTAPAPSGLGTASTAFGGFGIGVKPTATAAPTPNPGFSLGGTTTTSAAGTTLGMIRPMVQPVANPAGVVRPQVVPSTGQNMSFGMGAATGGLRPMTMGAGLGMTGPLNPAPPAYTAPSTGLGGQVGLNLSSLTAPSTTSSTLSGLLGAAPKTMATGLSVGTGITPAFTTGATSTGMTAPTGLSLKLPPSGTSVAGSSLPGFGLGQAATSTASTGFGLGTAATSTTQASLTTATTTTSSTAHTPSMNYTQLEEQINKWMLELDDQEKNFLQKATQVNAWDRLLVDNGEKITQLNTDVERVKIDQQRLDHELDFILAQQRELEEMLVPLEKSVEQLPPVNYQQHADLEREHTYQLAENIDAQLKRMVQDLKEIIEHLNSNNSTSDNADPLVQIGKILNVHMDSLQWVDQNTAQLQRRVEEVSKQAELRRKEQERNFRLAYN